MIRLLNLRKVISFTYICLCIFGFMFQVNEVSIKYFKYITVSKIEIVRSDIIQTPSLVTCMRYGDILNRSKARTFGHRNYRVGNLDDIVEEESKLTVRQVFSLTPSAEEILAGCYHRIPNSYHMTNSCRIGIDIRVRKFLMQEFMCYIFTLKELTTYQESLANHAAVFPSVVFDIRLTNAVRTADHMFLFLYVVLQSDQDDLPYRSRDFGRKVIRYGENRDVPLYQGFILYSETQTIELLPPPYDTMCNPSGMYRCLHVCLMNNFVKQFNRMPFSEIIYEPLDLQRLTHNDLNNNETDRQAMMVKESCQQKCQHNSCSSSYTISSVDAFTTGPGRKHPISITFEICTPRKPETIVKHFPMYSFLEFVIHICTCVSLWFGVSMLSFNPTNIDWKEWVDRLKNRRKRRERHQQIPAWILVKPTVDRRKNPLAITRISRRVFSPNER